MLCCLLPPQAVQLLPEHWVQPGQELHLVAAHDTYAISFDLPAQPVSSTARAATAMTRQHHQPPATPEQALSQQPQPTGVPLFDPLWRAAYGGLAAVQSQVVKAIAQDPLEHRRVMAAALQLAMQPWRQQQMQATTAGQGAEQEQISLMADPHHAAALLTKLMA